jgi:hypothetical protein
MYFFFHFYIQDLIHPYILDVRIVGSSQVFYIPNDGSVREFPMLDVFSFFFLHPLIRNYNFSEELDDVFILQDRLHFCSRRELRTEARNESLILHIPCCRCSGHSGRKEVRGIRLSIFGRWRMSD